MKNRKLSKKQRERICYLKDKIKNKICFGDSKAIIAMKELKKLPVKIYEEEQRIRKERSIDD
jgi:hypothetical protein